jgi:hypothetical protein
MYVYIESGKVTKIRTMVACTTRTPSPDTPRDRVLVAGDEERPMPMHGGTSPGAPKGNKNAFKHGRYTAEAIARRRSIAELIQARDLMR